MYSNAAKKKGIIFDMDNTLLQSSIDFAEMKKAIFQLLVQSELVDPGFDYAAYTASQLIELGRTSDRFHSEAETAMWDVVVAYESAGMDGATLEEGAAEVLETLQQHYTLVILTNNARIAALKALEETGIIHHFDLIVGREQMDMLKPSPSGIHYILDRYVQIPADRWVMVGDSWIDGKAAQDGGVPFIAYRAKQEDMHFHEVVPAAYIQHLRELLAYLHK